MKKIIQNAVYIPSEEVWVKSIHRNDYAFHKWIENGVDHYVSVDGGLEYCKRCISKDAIYVEWSLDESDSFETVCDKLLWRVYGKDGKSEFKWVPLSECTTDHLELILKTHRYISGQFVEKVIKHILKKRKK